MRTQFLDRLPPPLRETPFRRYWTGYSLSQVGSQVSGLAVPLTAVLVLMVLEICNGAITPGVATPAVDPFRKGGSSHPCNEGGGFVELTKDADALYQLALVAMGSRQYQEARTLWLTAAQKAPGTWLELLGKGMAMYEDAPVHSEHGPAREYRLALAYLAVSFIQNPEPNPIALWYVADTSAKLGTGYRYQGAEAEQKLWRQLSLQAYSVIFSTWLYNDVHGYKTLSKVIEIGWAQERFLNLRQLHESLGYDDGDLIALPDSDFGATYDVRPIISELQAIQNYGEFSLMDQRPYQRQLLHLLVTINREEQQKSGDGWRERAMKRSIEKCRRSVYLDLPGFPALIRAGIRACDI